MKKWATSRKMTRAHRSSRWIVSSGIVVVLLGALTETAWAMGTASENTNTGTMNVLAANTITVEGVATEPIPNPVIEINDSMTITDSSAQAEFKDMDVLEQHLRNALKQDGIANENIWFPTPSFNSNNSGPQINLQLNVVVPNSSQLSRVVMSLESYEPNFLQNNYVSEQVLPLDPESIWPNLYQAALDNARSQAAALASDAGVQLGSVVAVSTVYPSGAVQPLSGPYPTSPSVPGLQLVYNNGGQATEVMAQLYVTFAINTPSPSNS